MPRAYYAKDIPTFCSQTMPAVLGEITRNTGFDLTLKQRNTWKDEIALLQIALKPFEAGHVAFEFTIPRIGDRVDTVFIHKGIIYLMEFKVGETEYPKDAIDQVTDYTLDLKYFHQGSHEKKIVPMVICTRAPAVPNQLVMDTDGVFSVVRCNASSLRTELARLTNELSDSPIVFEDWLNSLYMPTPTIIEAAQALYRGHDVKEISRRESDSDNLGLTSNIINAIIDRSKCNHEKSICFITGVPGAGKTLAGLNIANSRHNFDQNEHAVYLSGNGPLVIVLREALARDAVKRAEELGKNVKKSVAMKEAEAFIQNIHHFRDDNLKTEKAPIEKVAIFDEAQRAWTAEQTAKFLKDYGIFDWDKTEPEFLMSVMDRHSDWAVIICLVGGGQEINTGETGLPAWFDAIRNQFAHWKVYVSNQISDQEYTRGLSLDSLLVGTQYTIAKHLHLAVSLRSFRSEKVSAFVKALLDMDKPLALSLFAQLYNKYPITLTRNLDTARKWVRDQARGTERYGLIASSGARRLRTFGIWVQSDIKPEHWFLNDKEDVRSSYYLEDTATEFDIQGLEIDWAIVAWDADLRIEDSMFVYYSFKGTCWNKVHQPEAQLYLKNAYRVLLTRARQGFIIYIPHGSGEDKTRQCVFYDQTYQYLRAIGILEV